MQTSDSKSRVSRAIERLNVLGFWQILLLTVIVSEFLTALMNIAMSYLWWGRFSTDLFIIGVIDAFVVSLLAGAILISLLFRLRDTKLESARVNTVLENILRHSTDMAIAAIDLDYRVIYFNPVAEEIFGYSAEDVIGKNALDIHAAAGVELARFREAVDAVKDGGDFPINLANGEGDGRRYLEARVSGIMDPGGSLTGYVFMARDVTERRRAEDELRKSEERFRGLVEQAADAFIVHDLDGRVVDVNHFACELLGYTREELLRLDVKDLEAGATPEQLKGLWDRMEPGVPVSIAGLSRRKNGTTFPSEVKVGLFEAGGRRLVQALVRDVTERKLMEEALRDSEAKYKKLVEGSLVGVVIVQDGVFAYVNPRAAEILGYTPDEMTAKRSLLEVIHPDDRGLVAENVRRRISGEVESTQYSFRCEHKDGSVVHVEAHGMRTEYNGRPAIVSSILDITGRIKAEEALRESEAKFRGLVEQSLAGVAIVQDGRFAYVNPRYSEMLATTPEELLRKRSVFDVIHPEDVEYVGGNIGRLMKGETDAVHCRFRMVRGDDDLVNVEAHAASTLYNGRPAMFVTKVDVTERINAEMEIQKLNEELEQRVVERTEELHRSESRYRMLMEQASDAIVITDRAGNFISVNTVACEMLGYPREEYLRLNLRDIAFEEDMPQILDYLARVLSGQTVVLEANARKKDGSPLPIEVSAKTLEDGTVQAIARDVTWRRLAEQEKEKMQARLVEAQKMEAVGTLAGGIAHDFNNMLTVIKGDCSLAMTMVGEDAPAFSCLRQIGRAAARAAELTRKLLLFSRKKDLAPVPLDINRTIEDTTVMIGRLIGEDIHVQMELSPQLHTVMADAGSIGQVVMNLAVNSRDAMPAGGTLTIRTDNVTLDEAACEGRPQSRPGDFARLTVADTGAGMDEETLSHVFEPFYSSKKGGKGTGLGLAVVYGIVEQHGGWIDVSSRPGEGATFEVFLEMTPEAPSSSEPGRAEHAPCRAGRGERILLVEDEEGLSDFVSRALTGQGYKVTTAASGKEAFAIFAREEGRFDLVFTDVVLPGRSGIDLVEKLHAVIPELPVLISSGYTGDKAQWDTIRERGYLFLEKPYVMPELLRAVGEAIGAGRATVPAEREPSE